MKVSCIIVFGIDISLLRHKVCLPVYCHLVLISMSSMRGDDAPHSPTSTMLEAEAPNVGELVDQMGQVIKLLQEQKVCNTSIFEYCCFRVLSRISISSEFGSWE